MTYAEAKKALHKVGCAHATGDTLRVAYADVLAQHARSRKPEVFYADLQGMDDEQMLNRVRELSNDVWKLTDVLLNGATT